MCFVSVCAIKRASAAAEIGPISRLQLAARSCVKSETRLETETARAARASERVLLRLRLRFYVYGGQMGILQVAFAHSRPANPNQCSAAELHPVP